MYKLTSSAHFIEHKQYIGYGIAITKQDCIEIISNDISVNKKFVKEIADKCNLFNVAPEHLSDIIDDSIS